MADISYQPQDLEAQEIPFTLFQHDFFASGPQPIFNMIIFDHIKKKEFYTLRRKNSTLSALMTNPTNDSAGDQSNCRLTRGLNNSTSLQNRMD